MNLQQALPLPRPKLCGCGVTHTEVPKEYKLCDYGLFFDCKCGSTLLISSYREWYFDMVDELLKS